MERGPNGFWDSLFKPWDIWVYTLNCPQNQELADSNCCHRQDYNHYTDFRSNFLVPGLEANCSISYWLSPLTEAHLSTSMEWALLLLGADPQQEGTRECTAPWTHPAPPSHILPLQPQSLHPAPHPAAALASDTHLFLGKPSPGQSWPRPGAPGPPCPKQSSRFPSHVQCLHPRRLPLCFVQPSSPRATCATHLPSTPQMFT